MPKTKTVSKGLTVHMMVQLPALSDHIGSFRHVSRDIPVSVEGFLQVAPQVVSWQGISCTVPQGRSGRQRQILHSISGVAAVRGEDAQLMPCLFAVLGPSGAGKTTFMDILSGRKRDRGKAEKQREKKSMLLGVMTGASVPGSSLRGEAHRQASQLSWFLH